MGGAIRMGCIDDATLDAWIGGRLEGADLSRAERHLDDCELCSATLAVLAGGTPLSSQAQPALARAIVEPELDLERGTVIGRHVVLEALGRGAMGVVYLAWDPELERRVALKLMKPGFSEERVVREAQAMARLSHPNVVAIYDVGRAEGAIYLAMEYVPGTTLRAWLDAERRGWKQVRDAFLQAGEGLGAAHAVGLVHRDFKPDNVIVGSDGRVRVTDFGLARPPTETAAALDAFEEPALPELTRSGVLVGTPAYMAPEQLDGRVADAKSDQFALSVALWEGVFGERPFAGASIAELGTAIRNGPVRPSSSAVPRWLEQALRRGLAPRPEDRFGSLGALLDALTYDRKRAARGRVAAVVGAVVLAATLPMFVRAAPAADPCAGSEQALADVWSPARAERVAGALRASGAPAADRVASRVRNVLDGYAAEWTEAHRSTCRATRVIGEQSEQLLDARMQCLRARSQTVDALAAGFERADRELVARADDALAELMPIGDCANVSSLSSIEPAPREPERRARLEQIERDLARVRAESAAGRYRPALELARTTSTRALELGYRPLRAAAHLELAELSRKTAAYADAEREANDAVFLAESSRDDHTAAQSRLELLAIAGEQGRFSRIEELGRQARAAITRIGDPPLLRAALAHTLGVAATNTGRFDEAERELGQALELRQRERGEGSAEVARTLTALGNLARSRGQFVRALELHDKALAIDERLLGAEHPSIARHHHNRAGVLRRLHQPERALSSYERALVLEKRGFGARHAAVGLTENSIGLLELDRAATAPARRRFETAIQILGSLAHPDRGVALHNLGLALAAERRHREAISRLDAALGVYRETLGERHERVAAALAARSASERALGDRAAADASRKRALEIAREVAPSSPDAARLLEELTAPVPRARARTEPAKTPAPERPLGSTTYAPAQSWDPH